MKKQKIVILFGGVCIFLFILLILLTVFKTNKPYSRTDYSKINIDGINKLMIVAHPDDEILWGGTKLIQDDYLVVCVTCGSNQERVKEFETVMNKTGDAYVMLGYPDKTRGKRDNWDKVRHDLIDDLKNIYDLKNWKEVITHNPDGEYGHIHHKMISSFVTDIVDKNRLKYFGKYYSKKKIDEENIILTQVNDNLVNKKKDILELYVSQKSTIDKFSHMIASEDILTYTEWMERYNEKNK